MTLRTLLTQILPGFSCCRERGSPSALRVGCSPALQFSASAAARSRPRHCVRRHCRLCRHKSSPDHPSEFGVRGADGRSYSSLGAGSAPALRFIARAVAARRVNVLVDTADSADTNPARFSSRLVSRACENLRSLGNLVGLPVMAAGPKNGLADTADSADTKPCPPSPPATEDNCCFRHRKR